ncbi:MAG: filamentous hemagglutinin N-terminal domain-containing protein [Cyanobacteriota bacterium]|nr:filamentous hemagglutinin N-terminal domain-containing protein [Cyanobacteriota bacterium]
MKTPLHLPLLLVLSHLALNSPLRAQILPDDTLGGENSVVAPLTPQLERIDGGAIRGTHLFHSFLEFNINEGAAAYFSNPAGISNIFSRVTGSNPSYLLGTLGVFGDANLYFLNPNGILFGPNARLDIAGSFFASTANRIVLPDGTQFSATEPEALPLLSIETQPPIGLVFEGDESGAILNAGDLAVAREQNLTLIGGTVVNTGNLQAIEGNITLMAVPESGRAELSEEGRVARWDAAPAVGSSSSQPPTLSELVSGSGLGEELGVTVDAEGNARLVESGVSIPQYAGTTLVTGNVEVAGDVGGTVDVRGDRVGLFGATIDASGANGGGRAFVGGDYRGQDESLNASRTVVSEDTAIRADAVDEGDGGRVIVWAEETTGFYGTIDASGGLGGGDGGFVEVSGKENLIFRGEVDVEASMGTAGTLLLDPENIVIVNGSGAADDAQITGDGEILFADGGGGSTFTISEAALEGLSGNADIILEATNDITIDKLTTDGKLTFQRGAGAITFRAGGDFLMDLYDRIEGAGPSGQQIPSPSRTITILAGGNLTVGNINTRGGGAAPGGSVVLSALGDITTANIDVYADNPPSNLPGNPYNSGNITITSTQGNIDTSTGGLAAGGSSGNPGTILLDAAGDIIASEISNGIVRGDGGGGSPITLISRGGSIDTSRLSTISDSLGLTGKGGILTNSRAESPIGGDITLQAFGDVTTGDIASDSDNQTGTINITSDTGNINTTAGTIRARNMSGNLTNSITLNAVQGNIDVGNIDTSSINADSSTITLSAPLGSIDTSSGTLDASSDGGNGGTVSLNASGNIIAGNINTDGVTSGGNITLDSQNGTIDTTAGTLDTSSVEGSGGTVQIGSPNDIVAGTINANGITSGGSITLDSQNNIDTTSGTLNTSSANGTGGAISLTPLGNLTVGNLNSSGGTAGGNLTLTSQNGVIDTTVGTLNTSSANGDGGSVLLDALTGNIAAGEIDTNGRASGGNITLRSPNSIDTSSGTLNTSSADGTGGAISLTPLGNLTVGNLNSSGGTAGGNLTLTSQNGVINTSAGTLNSSSANGSGGAVQIIAPDDIVAGAINTSGTLGGGTLNLRSDNGDIALTNQINTSSNAGNSGSIELSALNGDIAVSNGDIETNNTTGTAGDILIEAKTFTQSQGMASFNLSGEVQSGSLTIIVERFALDGNVQLALTAESGGIPQNLTLTTDELILENGARLSIETVGTTQAPNFIANIGKLARLSGAGGGIFFDTTSNGGAGTLTVTVPKATVEQGAQISNIVQRGDRGLTFISLPNSELTVEGTNSGISFENQGAGDADGITIEVATGEVTLENGAEISVSGTGSGSGGTLNIIADSLSMNNNARLTAATFSGKGGEIDLQVRDSILLRFNSDIRADAQGTGEGGNIRLDVGGLILGFLLENSDVIATGIEGRGGNIEATAAGIFGFRLYQNIDTPESDFTASSQFGIDGTVAINIRDPLQIEPLADEFFDRELLVGCDAPGRDADVRYFEVGNGGLPSNPGEPIFRMSPVPPGWLSLPGEENERSSSEELESFELESRPITSSACSAFRALE